MATAKVRRAIERALEAAHMPAGNLAGDVGFGCRGVRRVQMDLYTDDRIMRAGALHVIRRALELELIDDSSAKVLVAMSLRCSDDWHAIKAEPWVSRPRAYLTFGPGLDAEIMTDIRRTCRRVPESTLRSIERIVYAHTTAASIPPPRGARLSPETDRWASLERAATELALRAESRERTRD